MWHGDGVPSTDEIYKPFIIYLFFLKTQSFEFIYIDWWFLICPGHWKVHSSSQGSEYDQSTFTPSARGFKPSVLIISKPDSYTEPLHFTSHEASQFLFYKTRVCVRFEPHGGLTLHSFAVICKARKFCRHFFLALTGAKVFNKPSLSQQKQHKYGSITKEKWPSDINNN